MANRRDQYQGYRFAVRRQAGALLRADLDTADGPLRRLSGGALASVVVALLAMLCAGLFGLISPSAGSKGWENGKTLIVDSQTGTRYVYLDGALHPILNYASALLILKSGSVSASRVSDTTVNSVPHGSPVGIPGAPDTVPGSGSLLTGTWSVCSSPAIDAAHDTHPLVQATVGAAPGGSTIAAGTGLVVQDPAAHQYLIWNNTKLRITASYVLPVIGASTASIVHAGTAWLDAVPQGSDLTAPVTAGRGDSDPAVAALSAGATVGEVFRVTTTGVYYVAETDGLAPITGLQASLQLTAQNQTAPIPLSAAQVQNTEVSKATPGSDSSLPSTQPKLVTPPPDGTELCAQVANASQGTVTITTRPLDAQILPNSPPEPEDALGAALADTVSVPSGKGALVRATAQPNETTGSLFLITDFGVKYPVPSSSVLTDLGLNTVTASQLPQSVVALIPTGPSLDETAALAQQADNPPDATTSAVASAGQ